MTHQKVKAILVGGQEHGKLMEVEPFLHHLQFHEALDDIKLSGRMSPEPVLETYEIFTYVVSPLYIRDMQLYILDGMSEQDAWLAIGATLYGWQAKKTKWIKVCNHEPFRPDRTKAYHVNTKDGILLCQVETFVGDGAWRTVLGNDYYPMEGSEYTPVITPEVV